MSTAAAGTRWRRVAHKPAPQGWLSAPLVRVLREVLAEGRPVDAASASHTRPPRLGPAPGCGVLLAAAERELARVHLCELAYLLREASRLRSGGAPGLEARACREGLAEALECAGRDGLDLAPAWRALARACAVADPCRWPQASLLVRASLEVEPCEEGRAALARALLCEGDPRGAARALAWALLSCPNMRRGAGLLDELALVEERLGCTARAGALRDFAARAREVA